jgi:hypothetical protein
MSPNAGGGGCEISANEYSCTNGVQINFGDLAPYLTYGPNRCEFNKTISLIGTLLVLYSRDKSMLNYLSLWVGSNSTDIEKILSLVYSFLFDGLWH